MLGKLISDFVVQLQHQQSGAAEQQRQWADTAHHSSTCVGDTLQPAGQASGKRSRSGATQVCWQWPHVDCTCASRVDPVCWQGSMVHMCAPARLGQAAGSSNQQWYRLDCACASRVGGSARATRVSRSPLSCTSSIALTLGASVLQELGAGKGSHQGPKPAEPPQQHSDCRCQATAPTPGHSCAPPVAAAPECKLGKGSSSSLSGSMMISACSQLVQVA